MRDSIGAGAVKRFRLDSVIRRQLNSEFSTPHGWPRYKLFDPKNARLISDLHFIPMMPKQNKHSPSSV